MNTLWLVAPSPSPLPAFDGDPDMVTPGVLGFVVTFLIAIATVLLVIDMVRRIRRIRYRDEVREQLEAERAERDGATSPDADAGTPAR